MMSKTKAPIKDFYMLAGDDWSRQITWSINSVPVNITGYSVTVKISAQKGQETPDIELTVGSGVTLIDAANGKFSLTVTDAQSLYLKGVYFYDVKMTSAGGQDDTILEGTFNIRERV
jgi:hypothetical protein